MKSLLIAVLVTATLFACTEKKEKSSGSEKKYTKDNTYEATFAGDFTQDVSDSDVHAVMMSYKEWENANMNNVASYFADSIMWQRANGEKNLWAKADLVKYWTTYRDSLSSVVIKMDAWDRAYDTTKKMSFVVTWYREYDTYKSGKVDSADFADVNGVQDGKIGYYSQYRRALK
ncbi:MAG: hypothetical protein IPQ08_00150 [Chitinophagaceae bacterium]|nr:hypothetical protein [Chitinophagaceae bacterium]